MINKTILIGHTGKDSETIVLENGRAVVKFSLATSESWKDKSGEWQQKTEWHNIVQWHQKQEYAKGIPKGTLLYIEGKIEYDSYEDKEGVKRYKTHIKASTVRRLEKTTDTRESENIELAGKLPF